MFTLKDLTQTRPKFKVPRVDYRGETQEVCPQTILYIDSPDKMGGKKGSDTRYNKVVANILIQDDITYKTDVTSLWLEESTQRVFVRRFNEKYYIDSEFFWEAAKLDCPDYFESCLKGYVPQEILNKFEQEGEELLIF